MKFAGRAGMSCAASPTAGGGDEEREVQLILRDGMGVHVRHPVRLHSSCGRRILITNYDLGRAAEKCIYGHYTPAVPPPAGGTEAVGAVSCLSG